MMRGVLIVLKMHCMVRMIFFQLVFLNIHCVGLMGQDRALMWKAVFLIGECQTMQKVTLTVCLCCPLHSGINSRRIFTE